MEHIKTIFTDSSSSNEMEAYAIKTTCLMRLQITESNGNTAKIELNKSTAIRLAKELRKQISYLKMED